ncbi:MAG: hypothetical protein LC114_19115 [Bryobacterales bacterium]|nr:hypothetical protein [Bryobacterales bacterium]
MTSESSLGGIDRVAEGISIAEVLAEIRQRWRIPLTLLFVPVVSALALSLLLRPQYRADIVVREADIQQQGWHSSARRPRGLSLAGMDIADIEDERRVATLKSNDPRSSLSAATISRTNC